MSRKTVAATVALVLLVVALLFGIFAGQAQGHAISGWGKVVATNVNGLCGQGASTCFRSTMRGRYLYDSGHWRVYEVEWYNIRPWIGPWGTYRCRANKVWVEHNARIGSKTKPDLCWDKKV